MITIPIWVFILLIILAAPFAELGIVAAVFGVSKGISSIKDLILKKHYRKLEEHTYDR